MKTREYKRIYCCGDCVNYNMKRHKCVLGAHEEGDARSKFYADCPLKTYVERVKEE